MKSLDENVDQGHDPEQLRPEQAGEDEVDPQPQGEGDSVTACGPKGSADGAGAEGFGFGDRRAGRARRGVRQRWGHRGNRDGGRGDRVAHRSCSHDPRRKPRPLAHLRRPNRTPLSFAAAAPQTPATADDLYHPLKSAAGSFSAPGRFAHGVIV